MSARPTECRSGRAAPSRIDIDGRREGEAVERVQAAVRNSLRPRITARPQRWGESSSVEFGLEAASPLAATSMPEYAVAGARLPNYLRWRSRKPPQTEGKSASPPSAREARNVDYSGSPRLDARVLDMIHHPALARSLPKGRRPEQQVQPYVRHNCDFRWDQRLPGSVTSGPMSCLALVLMA